jgi:hypothetical protein
LTRNQLVSGSSPDRGTTSSLDPHTIEATRRWRIGVLNTCRRRVRILWLRQLNPAIAANTVLILDHVVSGVGIADNESGQNGEQRRRAGNRPVDIGESSCLLTAIEQPGVCDNQAIERASGDIATVVLPLVAKGCVAT